MFAHFINDMKRLNDAIEFQSSKKYKRTLKIKNVLLNPSFYLVACFRLSSFLKSHHVQIIPQIITFIESIIFSSSIHHSAKIGPGLLIPHRFCIVIAGEAEIGNNATIFHEVTIGGNAKKKDGAPKIGNNVTVYAGAKILGPINIGDNVRIGANSVVLTSVPDNMLAVGNPARIIEKDIQYVT